MKITKIEYLENLSVKLEYKKHWWSRKLSIMTAHTNFSGPTYHSESIKFLYYFDDLGIKLDDEISEQIFAWIGISKPLVMEKVIPLLRVRNDCKKISQ